jgi:hypothetical protein
LLWLASGRILVCPLPIEYRPVARANANWRIMAFSAALAERIRRSLARRKNVEEKKMFGGVAFLLHGNLLVGVWKDSLIVRLGPDDS